MEEKGEPPVSLPFAAGSVAEADLRLDYCSERHETNHRVFASNWPMLEAWIYDSDQSTGPFETNGPPPPPFLIPSSQPPLDSAIPHHLMIDEVGSQLFQAIEFRLTLFLTLIVLLGLFIPVQGMESRDEVDKDHDLTGGNRLGFSQSGQGSFGAFRLLQLCPGQKSAEVIFMLREQLIQSLPRLVHLTQGELASTQPQQATRIAGPPARIAPPPYGPPLLGGDYGG
jgi:hypothetical protein